jgi:hypothetical protein
MATGYVVTGRGDLDGLFLPRTSAAIANTGFLSNGGVDLAQRFEPRGASTAIPNTGFRAGATDLAQLFKNIADAAIPTALNMTAGSFTEGGTGRTNTGYALSGLITGTSGIGSVSASTIGSNTLAGLFWTDDDDLKIALNNAGGAPADVDTSWQRVDVTGVFQGSGSSTTRSVTRSARTSTSISGTRRIWVFNPGVMAFANGQVYAVTFYRNP